MSNLIDNSQPGSRGRSGALFAPDSGGAEGQDWRAKPLHMVIPVYNEGANFPGLWQAIRGSIKSEFEAFVVYDFDQDNTLPVVHQIIQAGEGRLHLLLSDSPGSVAGAIRTGFAHVPAGPVLVVMADLSDDLAQVDRMLALYRQGYDLVAGSRYSRGGQMIGGPRFKKMLSRLAGVSLHWLRGLPTSDATNAFKLYDAAMLQSLDLQSEKGFEISLEITVKAFLNGYRIAEIPTTWRDRSQGESRFRLWVWLPRYLKWYALAFQRRKKAASWKGPAQDQGGLKQSDVRGDL